MLFWRRLSLAIGACALVLLLWLDGGLEQNRLLLAKDIQPNAGRSYSVTLPRPLPLFALMGDDSGNPYRARTTVMEEGRPLGPAHALHDVIRSKGLGAFSHWGNALYFSTSDNTDPRTNGRIYRAKVTVEPTAAAHWLVLFFLTVTMVANVDLPLRGLRAISRTMQRIPGVRWVWVNVVPGLIITLILLVILVLVGEVWIRNKAGNEKFTEIKWPGAWSPELGFTFAPNAEIQYTNHLDFWVRQKTNSYGFADREWTPEKAPGTLRVALLGDSFLEAIQVPIAEKLQVKLEDKAEKYLPGRKLETAAFGMSGTGQSNQIPFYDHVARKFQPDIVVLVVVSNDFANNSLLLECVRNGWHPDHPPRFFFTRKRPGEPLQPTPLDKNWADYQLPDGSTPVVASSRLAAIHRALNNKVFFYNWGVEAVQVHFPKQAAWLLPQKSNQPTPEQMATARIAAIRQLPGYEHALDGWNFPDDWGYDDMFGIRHLPPVFEEALEATSRSLDEFKRRAERDGFRLVLFLSNSMSEINGSPELEAKTGNLPLANGRIIRLKQLAEPKNIPIVVFGEFLARRKIDPESLKWAHDGHWNPRGHELAAEALLEAFQAHPEWLQSARIP